jgi:hypothetical protein
MFLNEKQKGSNALQGGFIALGMVASIGNITIIFISIQRIKSIVLVPIAQVKREIREEEKGIIIREL